MKICIWGLFTRFSDHWRALPSNWPIIEGEANIKHPSLSNFKTSKFFAALKSRKITLYQNNNQFNLYFELFATSDNMVHKKFHTLNSSSFIRLLTLSKRL